MKELTALLQNATKNLPESYFNLMITGDKTIYRERVYCYELYHQLRCIWPATTEYYLNGELDKAAHPILSKLGAAGVKPDLLIHKPGYMNGNHAVMEIKSSQAQRKGIIKDLKNLALFKNKVKYERAIYLIFGSSPKQQQLTIQSLAQGSDDYYGIEIWYHQYPGQPAIFNSTL